MTLSLLGSAMPPNNGVSCALGLVVVAQGQGDLGLASSSHTSTSSWYRR